MLVIRDEQAAKRLQERAQQENRSVDEMVIFLLDQLPPQPSQQIVPQETALSSRSEGVQRALRKAYAKARRYWESVGDSEKAALTDEQLYELFGAFDEEGIPRLKSELSSLEPPVGSLAYAAKIAETSRLSSGNPELARNSEEILEQHFADDVLRKSRGEDAV